MDLDELKEIMTPEDFYRFLELFEREEDMYTPEWFEAEEMKEEILEKYDIDYPEDSDEVESDNDYY
ncbi:MULTISPECIES: hypothetical protein [Psychrilyobacter]|uniref:Uncharacterized protein n=1 Tax=Psychrilyobacter piezotolerans TaxID=2293438 RepID=A0ABX9KF99_9FUSO|nr:MULTISPECIES: hypothetical protein [Psychrilyobacter]MCS5420890.1 hypothetical protein [Psychrilyobacter sp. S5]NDI78549.1 hypothetical protein [Psychrilyobacter piezotolerans]RDE60444.1 hypothetical protein DV867_10670 [Psychrilyobacter sp. S5]REI40474.1 hypothetical protein DYH56_10670 [Psychrilyobacter piezotolerans]